jgi:hypothetical protein
MAEKTLSKLLPVAIARPAATRTFEAWYAPIKGKARRYVSFSILNDEVLTEGSRSLLKQLDRFTRATHCHQGNSATTDTLDDFSGLRIVGPDDRGASSGRSSSNRRIFASK